MKPFDYEAAQRGAAVCTAIGDDVTLLSTSGTENYPVVGLIGSNTAQWTKSGRYLRGVDQPLDLKMKHDDYLDRLARGEYGKRADANKDSSAAADTAAGKPSCIDPATWLCVLSSIFSSNAVPTRLRINIEYDGAAKPAVDWKKIAAAAIKKLDAANDKTEK